jgi:hypothetical protein
LYKVNINNIERSGLGYEIGKIISDRILPGQIDPVPIGPDFGFATLAVQELKSPFLYF